MGVAQHRARLALVCAVAMLGAACTSPSEESTDDTTNAASSTSSDPSASATATDGGTPYERPTVEPPGDLEGALTGDDLLVVGSDTLPDELVDRITSIKVGGDPGVAAAYQFSLGQIPVENRVLDIAAVDVAEYRKYTRADSAQFQDQWDRVANGEMAVTDELNKRLPIDKDGYLALSTGEKTNHVHVASYYPQVGTVDGVVNTAWADVLGMVEGNALVIHTGVASPQAVDKQLKKLLDKGTSVYEIDAVGQYGLDTSAVQVANVGTFGDAVGVFRYSVIGGGRIAPEAAWVREHIVTETLPLLGRLTCNKAMMPQLRGAMLEIQTLGLGPEIEYHVGCYYPRFIAGSTTLSNHSFGLAIDINSLENQRGTVGEMHPVVVDVMKKWGFAWGGDWNYTDPMHFELERIVRAD
jgi:hypothetical protein